VKDWLALDKRSLGLFRIALGLCLVLDVFTRGLYFRAHYSSQGIFPLKDYLLQPGLEMRRWSLMFINDTPLFVGLFFLVMLVAAILFTLGYRIRWTGWLCWILWVSVFRRNPLITNAGDIYLPLLLFWGNFLPWAERFSVQPEPSGGPSYARFPAFCYQIQVCILYWFSAIFRSGEEWMVDHSALYFALKSERYNTIFSPYLLMLGDDILSLVTWLTLILEFLGPWFLLLPWWRVRALCVFLIVAFHFGILLGINIPLFALVGAIGPLGMLPGRLWETRFGRAIEARLDRLLGPAKARLGGGGKKPTSSHRLARLYPWLTVPAMALMLFGLYRGVYYPDKWNYMVGVVRVFSLDQRWGMFSPSPPRQHDWDLAPATTASGRVVNLLDGGEYRPEEAAWRFYDYPWNLRWMNLHMVLSAERRSHTQLYLQYLVERWNEAHPEDPVQTARYEYHFRVVERDYFLGRTGTLVYGTYHR